MTTGFGDMVRTVVAKMADSTCSKCEKFLPLNWYGRETALCDKCVKAAGLGDNEEFFTLLDKYEQTKREYDKRLQNNRTAWEAEPMDDISNKRRVIETQRLWLDTIGTVSGRRGRVDGVRKNTSRTN